MGTVQWDEPPPLRQSEIGALALLTASRYDSGGIPDSRSCPAACPRYFSEWKHLLKLISRGLAAILADLEGLRIADFASPFFAVEFDQSIAVSVRIPRVALGKISAHFFP